MNLIEKIKTWWSSEKIAELENRIKGLEKKEVQELPEPKKGLIKKCIYNVGNNDITIVLESNNILNGTVEPDIYEKIKVAATENEIINYLFPKPVVIQNEEDTSEQEIKELITPVINILDGSDYFDVEGEKVFLKGIKSIEIPSSIVSEFIRLEHEIIQLKGRIDPTELDLKEWEDNKLEFNSLIMFTYWLLLNPIDSSRNDCLTFMKKNQITLTSNGLMKCYRRVVSKGSENKDLVKFVSDNYTKLKKWKKSPKNYWVNKQRETENTLMLVEDKIHNINLDGCLGNLAELYNNLSNLEENLFTDAHTRSKTIKIGEIYREDEDKIDLDNRKDCSSGLECVTSL